MQYTLILNYVLHSPLTKVRLRRDDVRLASESGANGFRFAKLGAPAPQTPGVPEGEQPWTLCNQEGGSIFRRRTRKCI